MNWFFYFAPRNHTSVPCSRIYSSPILVILQRTLKLINTLVYEVLRNWTALKRRIIGLFLNNVHFRYFHFKQIWS